MDDGRTEVCPFDPNHIIRSCKFEYHLIKCGSSNRVNFQVCPFNARHYIPKNSMRFHLALCEDRVRVAKEIQIQQARIEDTTSDTASENFGSTSTSNNFILKFPDEENWDEEIKEAKSKKIAAKQQPRDNYCDVRPGERKEIRNQLVEKFKNQQGLQGQQ